MKKRKWGAPPWSLLFLGLLLSAAAWDCADKCQECFGRLSTECTKCNSPYVLLNYECVDSCPSTHQLDAYDRICKPTIYRNQDPCKPGTFNSGTGASNADTSCKPCSGGRYCPGYGQSQSSSNCDAGFYCKQQSPTKRPVAGLESILDYYVENTGSFCPTGTYCAGGSENPTTCDKGFYCPKPMMSAKDDTFKCAAGFYCSGGATTPTPTDGTTGNVCPTGHYCEEGSSEAVRCPIGTYLGSTGGTALSDCLKCRAGYYCSQEGLSAPEGLCDAGHYCPGGQVEASPVSLECQIGYYCPQGTSDSPSISQKRCAPGKYTSITKQTSCSDCPVGSFCQELNAVTTCSKGYYCPGGDRKIACPIGTYNQDSGQQDNSACKICTGGKACDTPATSDPSKPCDEGYFCTQNAKTKKPVTTAQGGGMCTPGQLCSQGSTASTSCDVGRYCKDYAMAGTSSGMCAAGYYCSAGSKTETQEKCASGYYCPAGTTKQIPCPIGTYSESQGASTIDYCQPCPAGYTCDQEGLNSLPTTDGGSGFSTCPAGYYCAEGSVDSTSDPLVTTKTPCEAGYECPADSLVRKKCQMGTYQDLTGQASCKECPVGQYCDGDDTTRTKDCPAGFYCPLGTKHAEQYPCPAGSYNPNTKAESVASCLSCPANYYCEFKGTSALSTKIPEGFFNINPGQTKPAQDFSSSSVVSTLPQRCPMYAYCPEGSIKPTPCPDGSYTPWRGSFKLSHCISCPRGKFCRFASLYTDVETAGGLSWTADSFITPATALMPSGKVYSSDYFGDCLEGYICLEGSTSRTPSSSEGYQCPAGHACLAGATIPVPCPASQYASNPGSTVCTSCPAGSYCTGSGVPEVCPAGHYCPSGQDRPVPCPEGYFRSATGATSISGCNPCTAGEFCEGLGLSSTSGPCRAGFVCQSGATTPAPYKEVYDGSTVKNGKCPAGSYCSQRSGSPQACPQGTYNPEAGVTECRPCEPGKYCAQLGRSSPDGDCAGGYYCKSGAYTSTPSDGVTGNKCPKGFFCPPGSSTYLECPDGYTSTVEGAASCEVCPNGYSCRQGTTVECEAYKYCSDGANYPYGQLCPAGTYLDSFTRGVKSVDDCKDCPAGKYCLGGRIAGLCAAGFICKSKAPSPTPDGSTADTAFPCAIGYYCPEGTSKMMVCPAGYYTYSKGAKSIDECTTCIEGYYCKKGDARPEKCPHGHYCPAGSEEPTPCPKGRYNKNQGGKHLDDCRPCESGYYCNEEGIDRKYRNYPCPAGKFCPPGTLQPYSCKAGTYARLSDTPGSIRDCRTCPVHHYCPIGAQEPILCPDGTYCPSYGMGFPKLCPPGKKCLQKGSSIEVLPCPEGFYCPMEQGIQVPCDQSKGEECPEGSDAPSFTVLSVADCKEGEYYGYGICKPCEAGFVCLGATSQRFPLFKLEENGYQCPSGHYCPQSTGERQTDKSSPPVACPAGTYRTLKGGKSLEDCLLCPSGTFNSEEGSTGCSVCGTGATSDATRTTCSCIGAFRTWKASTKTCVCEGDYTDPGFTSASQTSTASSDCQPIFDPGCPDDEIMDEVTNECVKKPVDCSAEVANLCPAEVKDDTETKVFFDEELGKCVCSLIPNSEPVAADYITDTVTVDDVEVTLDPLKAYFLSSGDVLVARVNAAGEKSDMKCFTIMTLGPTFMSGLVCDFASGGGMCLLTTVDATTGMGGSDQCPQIFLDAYETGAESPCPSVLMRRARTRQLQDSSSPPLKVQKLSERGTVPSAIILSITGQPVSFQVNSEHFPVFLRSSPLNRNASDYDDGYFDLLRERLEGGIEVNAFSTAFTKAGVYVFIDSSALKNENLTSFDSAQTIIKVVDPPEGWVQGDTFELANYTYPGIVPLSRQAMENLGLMRAPLKMKALPPGVDYLHIVFAVIVIIAASLQQILEIPDRLKNGKREDNKITLRRGYEEGESENIILLIDQIHNRMQADLDKVTTHLNQKDGPEEVSLRNLIEDKLSLANELNPKSRGELDDIIKISNEILNNLRFKDGRSLKDQTEEFQEQQNLKNEEDDYDEEDDDPGDSRRNMSSNFQSDEDREQFNYESDDGQMFDDQSQQEDSDDGEEEDQDLKIQNEALEQVARAEADIHKQKQAVAEALDGIPQAQKEQMLKELDTKMLDLTREADRLQKKQDEKLKEALIRRQERRQKAKMKFDDRTKDESGKIRELENQIEEVRDDLENLDEVGIKQPEMKEEIKQEKEKAAREQDDKKEGEKKKTRDEYMDRINRAKTSAEKERLLTEMESQLKLLEKEKEREKRVQLQILEKSIKDRQRRQVEKQIQAKEAEIAELTEKKEGIELKKDAEEMKLYAEGEDFVPDFLSRTVDHMVFEAIASKDKEDISSQEQDQLDIVKVRHQAEKDKAAAQTQAQMDEEIEEDKRQLQDQAVKNVEAKRQALRDKLNQAQTPKLRKELLNQLQNFDQQRDQLMQEESLKQERMLEDRKKARQAKKKARELELQKKQGAEINQTEIAIRDQKLKGILQEIDAKGDKQLAEKLAQINSRRDDSNKEQSLVLANELINGLMDKKLELLLKKQFFELAKNLANLHSGVAVDRLLGMEAIKQKFKEREGELISKLSGEELNEELDKLHAERRDELSKFGAQFDEEARNKEFNLRKDMEDRFLKEKKEIVTGDLAKKKNAVEKIAKQNKGHPLVQTMAAKLKETMDRQAEELLEQYKSDREANLEVAKCKMIADSEAEVRAVQREIDSQLEVDKKRVEEGMKQRLDAQRKEHEADLERRTKELRELRSQDAALQIQRMREQHERELAGLEGAIKREEELQIAKFRKALFEKKIERETKQRKKREEEEAKRKAEESAAFAAQAAQSNSFNTTRLGGFGAAAQTGTQDASEDILRLLLAQWAERVKEAKGESDENVWEKQTFKDEGPPPKEQEEEVVETGLLADQPKPIDYTLAGLWNRMRKIEKLTDKIRKEEELFQQMNPVGQSSQGLRGSSSGAMLRSRVSGAEGPPSLGARR